MNYAAIKTHDIANGPGIRLSLFVSGCEHYCKNCFNKEAWGFDYGKQFTEETFDYIAKELNSPVYSGLTILGGEPFHPKNEFYVAELIIKLKILYPDLNIWVYTGYLYEDLISEEWVGTRATNIILRSIDTLVDGKFVEELKDLGLNYRGSSNQRIIDVKKSIAMRKVVLDPLCIGDTDKYKNNVTFKREN